MTFSKFATRNYNTNYQPFRFCTTIGDGRESWTITSTPFFVFKCVGLLLETNPLVEQAKIILKRYSHIFKSIIFNNDTSN